MLPIILKIILCSGALLGLYHLFLAKEKTLVFNRFYLLSALVFSLCIPFATIEIKQPEKENATILSAANEQSILQMPITAQQESFDFSQMILIIYFAVAGIFILKIVYSIAKIRRLKGRKIIYQNRNVFLLNKNLAPFSFWNTIYISEADFNNSIIDPAVFMHEEIHVRQKHSIDVLFIEILKAVCWFNPIFYLYKKAIINNHEFIADEGVIAQNKNVKNYQELILQEILKQQNLPLIHQFNFNNTKKRFIMMTRKNSKFAKAKRYLVIPVFAVAAIVFAEKTYAKVVSENISIKNPSEKTEKIIPKRLSKEDKQTNYSEIVNTQETNHLKTDTIRPKTKTETNSLKQEKENTEDNPVPPPPPPSTNFVQAEYPGGMVAIRNKFMQNFDGSILESDDKDVMKSVVYMTIDKDGNVDNIIAKGDNEKFNREAERALKTTLADTKWKPATNDGEKVKTALRFPIAMAFESAQKTQ